MRKVCCFPLMCILMTALASPAAATQQFYKVFVTEYLDNHPDQQFAEHVKKDVKCYVCHQGKERKHRNAFGAQLSELLDAKKDGKDTDKIIAALKTVADMHVTPGDDKSETFGQRVAAGKLPAGELDDLKKEPAE
jgi:hypothetical protein